MNNPRDTFLPGSSTEPLFSRRRAVQTGGAGLAAVIGGPSLRTPVMAGTPVTHQPVPSTPTAGTPISITGSTSPELAAFDTVMTDLLGSWGIPGGQLALAKDGRLVHNRGYGLADVERGDAVESDARFRIASVSKTLTAVAILTLIDAGELTLDDRVFPLLDLPIATNSTSDPRLDEITVQHLLTHSGGWDSSQSMDPQYLPWNRMAAATLGMDDPADGATIVQFMLGVPLDFPPGESQAYSNLGFNVLGRVIEKVSGRTYEDYVRTFVLAPAGVTDMVIGGTTLAERFPGEVRYYSPSGLGLRPSVYWGEGYVPVGYGSFYLESLDAHGGWIGSAASLIRFATAIDGQRSPAILTPAAVDAMITTPRPQSAVAGAGNQPVTAGLGWGISPVDGGEEWSHAGALEGSNAAWLFRRTSDGLTLAFLFNSLPEDFPGFFTSAISALLSAAGAVSTWPAGDLFESAS